MFFALSALQAEEKNIPKNIGAARETMLGVLAKGFESGSNFFIKGIQNADAWNGVLTNIDGIVKNILEQDYSTPFSLKEKALLEKAPKELRAASDIFIKTVQKAREKSNNFVKYEEVDLTQFKKIFTDAHIDLQIKRLDQLEKQLDKQAEQSTIADVKEINKLLREIAIFLEDFLKKLEPQWQELSDKIQQVQEKIKTEKAEKEREALTKTAQKQPLPSTTRPQQPAQQPQQLTPPTAPAPPVAQAVQTTKPPVKA